MTEKANPSINRPAEAFKTAGAIAYGGHGGDGFVVDGANPTDISVQDGGIAEADLNAFDETSDGDSLDVTIDGGEAFVFGSWLAIDTDTTVSLDASTDGQTVYVGWNKNGADDVIVGLAADFSDASGDTDERIPLWTFDTDGSGVTSVTDERQIGRAQDLAALSVADELDIPVYSDTANAPSTKGSVIAIDGAGSETAGLYSYDGTSYIKAGKTEEAVEDIVAGLITGGTSITVNYDDANDTLTINNDEPYSDEDAEDAIGAALSGGDKVSVTYDDANDSIIIDTSALNAEEVQDEVNTLLSGGDNISLTYDDENDTLTIDGAQQGAFLDTDSDDVGELITSLTGINLGDGEFIEFGSDADFDIQYNATADALRWQDKTDTTDRMSLDRTTGDLTITGELTENSSI